MTEINVIVIQGRMVRDVELREMPSGAVTTTFPIAVKRRPPADKVREVDYIDITAWGQVAEYAKDKYHKGDRITVKGRLQIREYTKDGVKRRAAEVVADSFHE